MQEPDKEEYFSSPNPPEIQLEVVKPTPDNPPWNSLVAIGTWIVSVFLILLIPTLFLLPYVVTLNPPIVENDALVEFAKNDPTAVLLQIISIIPAHLLTLILAWLVVTRFRKFSFRKTLGWASGGIQWWYYPAILIGFLVIAATVSQFFPEQDNDLLRILRSSRTAVYIVAFLATFTAPLVEEVIYRGILYSAFQRTVGVPAAFLLVTFLFALVHVPQYYPSYSTIFLLVLLSISLTALRVKSKNLLPCIILHTLFNGFQSVMLVVEPLFEKPELNGATAFIKHLLN